MHLGDRARRRAAPGSTWSNTSSHGTPSSCSITWTTCSSDSGGTWSWSCASSLDELRRKQVGRVDRICPSLQNVGPSSSSASRRRLAWRARPAVPSSSGRPNNSFRPCLAKTVAIFEPRAIRCGSGLGDRGAGAQRDAARGGPRHRRRDPVGRVDDDHGAAGVVADPVRHVAEQELLAPGHPGVADHEHVDRARRRRRRRSPSRGRRRRRRARGRASPARRSASRREGVRGRRRAGALGRAELGVRRDCRARSPARDGARRRTARRSRSPSPRPARRSAKGRCRPSRAGWSRRCRALRSRAHHAVPDRSREGRAP